MDHKPTVYVVSDSAGDTGESVVRAAAAQFYPASIEVKKVSFVHSEADIDHFIHSIDQTNGMIVFTLVIPQLRNYLIRSAEKLGIVYIDLLGPILNRMEILLGQQQRQKPGILHRLDEDYFKKVEAVEFAVKYDDGRDFQGILKADLVLIGVSRTSKTPLSMYLAHKKYKVANVPLIPELQPPEELFAVPAKKIIGLRIAPDKLYAIRKERLKSLGLASNASYANIDRIMQELEYAEKIMEKLKCVVIDVSNKAVEETAGVIMDVLRTKTT